MALDIPGLLGKFAQLPTVVTEGLLGPLPKTSLGLDPQQMEQARQSALTDMAYGMLAGSTAPGWRNQMGTVAVARQGAIENYRGRIFDMLKEQEYTKMQGEKEKLKMQLDQFRKDNPDKANLPDSILLQYMDPQTQIATSNLALNQQQAAQSIINADRNFGLQQDQLAAQRAAQAQAQANADRMYQLQLDEAKLAREKFDAELNAKKGSVDPTEARQRRDAARSTGTMLSLLSSLRADIDQNGTEFVGPAATRQSNLYGQLISEYKQAKQLGTLDKGLLDLFEKILMDPSSFRAMTSRNASILSQVDALAGEMVSQYQRDYEFLNNHGLAEGLSAPDGLGGSASSQVRIPGAAEIEAEYQRRLRQGAF